MNALLRSERLSKKPGHHISTAQKEVAAELLAGPHIARQLGLALTELNDDSMQKIVNIIGLAIVAGKTINATASGAGQPTSKPENSEPSAEPDDPTPKTLAEEDERSTVHEMLRILEHSNDAKERQALAETSAKLSHKQRANTTDTSRLADLLDKEPDLLRTLADIAANITSFGTNISTEGETAHDKAIDRVFQMPHTRATSAYQGHMPRVCAEKRLHGM